MIHLALLILAVYVIARAAVAVFGFIVVACAGITDWLDERPSRRKRFWWTVAGILATPVMLLLYAVSQ